MKTLILSPRIKRLIAAAFLFCCAVASSHSQGTWTWLQGDTLSALYGTATIPSGRYEAAQWTDLQGNFWIFGGVLNGGGTYNDLWKYNPNSGLWTTVSAGGNAQYGTQGIPSAANYPPPLGYGINTWVDLNGDLWMYAGNDGAQDHSALWRYNIANNMWTWMSGDTIPGVTPQVYGTMGVPSPSNSPGNRSEGNATWVDDNNNLWFFGGSFSASDLWKFDVSLGQWVWMKGLGVWNAPYSSGTKGVESPLNIPRPRSSYAAWKDLCGNFWFFGGFDFADTAFNDMWKYDPTSNNWTWMSGTNLPDNEGNHGARCTASAGYCPAGRFENRACWTDNRGNFWMYGGLRTSFDTIFADMWMFNPVTLEWTLVNGDTSINESPVYGIQGIAAAGNTPGGRGGAVSWTDSHGNFYLFGGAGIDSSSLSYTFYYNDMWKYAPDTVCAASAAIHPFNLGNDTIYCGAFSRVLSAGYTTAKWSTGESGLQITVTTPGTYWARLGCTTTFCDTIVISQVPGTGYTLGPDTTICRGLADRFEVSLTGATYLWSNGSTDSSLTTYSPGLIWVQVSQGGCVSRDSVVLGVVSPPIPFNLGADFMICPGSSIPLSTGVAATLWSTGEIGPQIQIYSPGVYWATINNGCGIASGTINVTAPPTPPSFTLGNDTIICGSFSIVLTSGFPNTYWSTGQTGPQITVTQPGLYWADVDTDCVKVTPMINIYSSTPQVTITADTNMICANDSAQICATPGFTSYQWNFGDTSVCIYTNRAGNYYVTATDQNNCSAESNHLALAVHQMPPVSISINSDTMVVYDAASIQWYLNGKPLPGATGPVLIAKQAGSYTVAVTDSNGCSTISNPVEFTAISNVNADRITVYPNPTYGNWYIEVSDNLIGNTVQIFDDNGRLVYQSEIRSPQSELSPNLAQGVYFLKINAGGGEIVRKLVKL